MTKTTFRRIWAAGLRNLRGTAKVAATALICSIALGSAHAQTLTGTNVVLTSEFPQITFDDNVGTLRTFRFLGFDSDFRFEDVTATTIPFLIGGGAPTGSIRVAAGNGFVGLGEFFPQTNLHGTSASGPYTFRMQDTSGLPNTWDVEGGGLGFNVKDVTGGTTPFSILPDAPTNSLFVAVNGSVGAGTNVPNNIGAASLPGKVFNVRTDAAGTAGVARFVTQGAGGAQFHLVHNNGPANQKVLRIQNASGITSFNFIKDNLTENLVTGALVIKNLNGNVGLKQLNPLHPLHMASGAHVTAGGVWTNASSRELKQDIEPITSEQAREAVRVLEPVSYRYKSDTSEQYAGFVAEDVPELVATNDRKGLASMDITAVLTRVVKDQQTQLEVQQVKMEAQQTKLEKQEATIAALMERLEAIERANAVAAKRDVVSVSREAAVE